MKSNNNNSGNKSNRIAPRGTTITEILAPKMSMNSNGVYTVIKMMGDEEKSKEGKIFRKRMINGICLSGRYSDSIRVLGFKYIKL